MKTNFFHIATGIFLTFQVGLSAQTVNPDQQNGAKMNIFDEIQTPTHGKGKVIIDQPAELRGMVGSKRPGEVETATDGTSFIRYQGFRIQIFSGNDQRTSKEEVFKREKDIKDAMPEISTYINYEAPFWRLRIGDFSEREDAYEIQQKLMKLLPNYRKEMYIVREEIKFQLNETN